MKIGARLKQIRTEKKITQVDFSKMLGVSQSYLSAVESNRTGVSKAKIEKFAKKLDVSSEALLTETNNRSSSSDHIKDIRSLEFAFKNNPEVSKALDILFEFDDTLSSIKDEHRDFFEKPLKALFLSLRKNKKNAAFFKQNSSIIKLLTEYSKLVVFIIETRKNTKRKLGYDTPQIKDPKKRKLIDIKKHLYIF